ncbi:MAG TPA: class I SAM-dependent DNA methyltransferase [Armatimonadota bacterium]|nr:class I SAM-dependent DNA methyltransferase [Armatimonadota bacterium]
MMQAKQISQSELESYLWGAATLLRGYIDAGDYKQFIFPLLFYKRLCDVFDEEMADALEESGGDTEYAELPEQHRFQIPSDAHWQVTRTKVKNVGKAIQDSLRNIEKANPDTLYGVFGDAQWTNKDRLPDHMLRELIEHFSSQTLSIANCPEDELGIGYEFLIKKFADDSGHTAAEFYTNRTVVHLMTEMLEPRLGESIYDPTCGSAGMLLSAVAHLKRQHKEWRNLRLYGQERNLLTSAIGRMNLFLHGIEDFRIVRGDTLAHPAFVEGDQLMRFDVVLANPPYSIKQWDRAAWSSDSWGRNIYGVPPQGRADYAFWQHIILSMKTDSGRCAILFPHGVLFRNEELAMREKLIAHDVVECVLGLGPNLFYNSPMEACVVICRMNKPRERRKKILFINAVNEVTRERAQSFLTDDHIQRIVDAYHGFQDIDDFARVITTGEIQKKNCNLSIPLYLRTEVDKGNAKQGTSSLSEVIAEWEASSQRLRRSMDQLLVSFTCPESVQVKETKPTKPVQPAFKRAVLAAEITAQMYEEKTFGAVKREKILFLCEKHLGLVEALNHHHLRQAAGPYDPGARRSIDSNFTKHQWFVIAKNEKGTHYLPGEKYGTHRQYFNRYFDGMVDEINRIIALTRSKKTEECEIIATLYSAWSDFLDQGTAPTDAQLVHEVLNNWTESKRRIEASRWHAAIHWMRNNSLTPRTIATCECEGGI